MRTHRATVVVVFTQLTGAMAAQVPAHATRLNPTTVQEAPTFVQEGDVVHAFAIGLATIFHARSLDGGRTWPLREQPLGALHSGPAANAPTAVGVVSRPGDLLVLGDNGMLGPSFVRSSDEGASWTAPTPIAANHVPQAGRMAPAMYANGATLLVAWTNDRPGGRVFCNRSVDNGLTWQPADTRLDVGIPASGVGIHSLRVIGAGPVVHVFWSDGLTYHQRSLDGGVTWWPGVVGMLATSPLAAVAGDGTVLLVAGQNGVLMRSANAGTTWNQVSTTGIANLMDLALAGPLVVAVGLNGSVPPTYLVNASGDGGVTWRPTPLALPSPSFNVVPQAIARTGELYVHWRIPGFPGGAMRSLDVGATWQGIDGPVQGGFCPGDRRTLHAETIDPTLLTRAHHAYVGVGSSRLGAATAGTGGFAPELATHGLPVRGGATTFRLTRTVGGSLAALGMSVAAPTSIPFGNATLHLATLDLLVALPTGGAGGLGGAGSAVFPLAVPNVAALVGTRLVAQALVVDGGATGGFATTNALEVWLR